MEHSIPPIDRMRVVTVRIASEFAAIVIVSLLACFSSTGQAQTLEVSIAQGGRTRIAASPGDWTQFLRDNMERSDPYEKALGLNTAAKLQLRLKFALGGQYGYASPAVANGFIYASSDIGTVFALNASTGEKLWSTTGLGAISGPSVADGLVYVGSADYNVYALSTATGAIVWRYHTGYYVRSSPTVANGVVYVGSVDDNVYALNAKTGTRLWSYATGGEVDSSPAVANGVVYAGSADGYMYALDTATGALSWKFITGGGRYSNVPDGIFSSPVVADGIIFFSGGDTQVYGLNARTGALVWTFLTGSYSTHSSPAVADGVVYFTSPDGYAHALKASTGTELWSYLIDPSFRSDLGASPVVANGVVYIASDTTGAVYALSAKTGAKLWSFANPGFFCVTAIVANGVFYCTGGTNGGYIYGFSIGADLNLRAQASAKRVHQGDLLTYTFPVWNLGPEVAGHEVLTTTVPAGTTFDYVRISGTSGLGACTHPAYGHGGPITCEENGIMGSNTTWTVRLTVKVIAHAGATIIESASAMEETLDPNPDNNAAAVSTKVQ